MKLTVTCDCGKENHVKITKTIAANILREGRKAPSSALLSDWGKKGSAKRWEGHKKTV